MELWIQAAAMESYCENRVRGRYVALKVGYNNTVGIGLFGNSLTCHLIPKPLILHLDGPLLLSPPEGKQHCLLLMDDAR